MSRLSALRPRRPATWRTLLGGFLIGAIVILLFGAACVAPWLLTHRSNLPGERSFGSFAVGAAARFNAGDKKNPLALDRETVQRGQASFTGSCAYCHGQKGDGKGGSLSAALFPPATDLTRGDAKEKSDAQLFWITKAGLSFTAIPGFKDRFNDDAIWAIVAYMRALQGTGPTSPTPAAIPTPSSADLLKASGPASDPVSRGAALYFAMNCAQYHGGAGNAPRPFGLRSFPPQDSVLTCQIRNGPNGMPAYDASLISDAQLADLIVFLRSLVPVGAGPPGGPPGSGPPGGGPPGGPSRGTPPPDVYSSRQGAGPQGCRGQGGGPQSTPGATPRATPAAP